MYSFDQLQAFVASALNEQQAEAINEHLASCAECRKAVDKLRKLASLTAQAESVTAPDKYFDTFASRLAGRIAAQKQSQTAKRFRFPLWVLAPAAAAVALALLVSLRPEQSRHALLMQKQAPRPEEKASPIAAAPATVERDKEMASEKTAPKDEQKREAPPGSDRSLAAARLVPGQKMKTGPPRLPPATQSVASPLAGRGVPKQTEFTPLENGGVQTRRMPASLSSGTTRPAAMTALAPGQCVPIAVGQLKVIVIHLPGGTVCPAPEIATAIEIVLPPGCAAN
ncbi:MAG: zf-HC2 domain-containing protein [Candidatus Edwardsbacteria bacterium]|nr:zf-HC2 domain-containing protein [Candidatus Edwardsbacteria bacterium]